MKKFILPALAVLAAVAAPMSASAHRGWLMPSHTVLSGDSFWVSFDAGASNGVFIADHAPLRLSPQSLVITAPDGSAGAAANLMQGAYRTTFDVEVNKPGTWKIANASAGMNAAWILNGTPGRWRGPAADMAATVPAGADGSRHEVLTQYIPASGQVIETLPWASVLAVISSGLSRYCRPPRATMTSAPA